MFDLVSLCKNAKISSANLLKISEEVINEALIRAGELLVANADFLKENNEIEIKQSMEYDLINKCLTGKKYYDYDKPRNQYKYLYQLPAININYITENISV